MPKTLPNEPRGFHTPAVSDFFTRTCVGERYDAHRPKVHHVVLQWLARHMPGRTFKRAVDVACGTGASTIPLLEIADTVAGIDSSETMLAVARAKGLSVTQLDYGLLPALGKFDLISTCMAFHWFNRATAIRAYKNASHSNAVWIIYNFGFAGHTSSDGFNEWFKNWYLTNYPSPPRNSASTELIEDDAEIHPAGQDRGWLPIHFTHQSLVDYLCTQSNIEVALQQEKNLDAVRRELLDTLGKTDIAGPFKYHYHYEIFRYTPED